ncbi:Alpha N-terminal protein methyltransferase 1B [Tritrichomonas musculus]|uniref:Alpha N-terminal protein methyltransferase 1 n=1 Tax=Tritrichomonas musculus TaxID=1915356 RepID=A0ABR2KX13_9EUKA
MTSKFSGNYPVDPKKIYQDKIKSWYVESRFYWSMQEPNVESMTQGPDELSVTDLRYTYFVLSLLKSEDKIKGGRIADCGGGIGRVSFQVLTHFYDQIDIIDPIPHFLLKAREYLEKELPVEIYQVGLEEWNPTEIYNAFFVQWTLCQLTDEDIVSFLRRCKESSTDDAYFFIKENIAGMTLKTDKSQYEFYPDKNSICRTYNHYCELFQEAGLILQEYRVQPNWPIDFLTVVLFVLRK